MHRSARRRPSSIAFEDCRTWSDFCNQLIDLCDQTLREKTGKEWILIVEDLDKTGISPQQLQELFIQYGTVFQDLRVNMIFTIPVWLAYSSEAIRLPFDRYMIHDTPVYDQKHDPHENGAGGGPDGPGGTGYTVALRRRANDEADCGLGRQSP